MPTDHHAEVAQLLSDYRRSRDQLAAVHHALATVKESRTSDDGTVTVTVGAGGILVDLAIGDDAYRRHRPADLARLILDLTTVAVRRAAERSEQAVAAVLPSDADPRALLAGTADLRPNELAPPAPRPQPAEDDDNSEQSWLEHSYPGRRR
ncbi:hypothetical protein GCM10012275_40900 [Longimycelium tulufanense]|uniref:YbaB/EbfC DNA-binding family protein n=1 Tax=Longimycelium tulufanense TaxID=907463 RepID=A0A8J3CH10_9PSEU|nr:YbaB/EbfC family nucleoid-associated protein [Longimycelium tulufanense]GGM66156.1 hypothetical protein GCM10012275_40900 [Longimycelium tulufanense]